MRKTATAGCFFVVPLLIALAGLSGCASLGEPGSPKRMSAATYAISADYGLSRLVEYCSQLGGKVRQHAETVQHQWWQQNWSTKVC